MSINEKIYKIIYTTNESTRFMEHVLAAPRHRNDLKYIKVYAKNLTNHKGVNQVWIYHLTLTKKEEVTKEGRIQEPYDE